MGVSTPSSTVQTTITRGKLKTKTPTIAIVIIGVGKIDITDRPVIKFTNLI